MKNSATNRAWFVRDNPTGHGIWIFPGADDGPVNSFSTKDAAPRLYHSAEDEPWIFGATGHLGYNNGENIQERDDIFWYVTHLYHEAAGGADQWHFVGPVLKVER